jgi:hypothetical protein
MPEKAPTLCNICANSCVSEQREHHACGARFADENGFEKFRRRIIEASVLDEPDEKRATRRRQHPTNKFFREDLLPISVWI